MQESGTPTKPLYSIAGLPCSMSRDVSKSRDLYTFSCDLRDLSHNEREKLQYCFEHMISGELSVAIETVDE